MLANRARHRCPRLNGWTEKAAAAAIGGNFESRARSVGRPLQRPGSLPPRPPHTNNNNNNAVVCTTSTNTHRRGTVVVVATIVVVVITPHFHAHDVRRLWRCVIIVLLLVFLGHGSRDSGRRQQRRQQTNRRRHVVVVRVRNGRGGQWHSMTIVSSTTVLKMMIIIMVRFGFWQQRCYHVVGIGVFGAGPTSYNVTASDESGFGPNPRRMRVGRARRPSYEATECVVVSSGSERSAAESKCGRYGFENGSSDAGRAVHCRFRNGNDDGKKSGAARE